MAWTATNPAQSGKGTKIGDITAAFQNTLELASGGKALDRILATPIDITTTGTVNDHSPGAVVIVRCNNATPLTINGIVPFGSGQIRVYENVGSSTVSFAHQNTGSSAVNRIILASTAGQILGFNGSIGFRYDNTSQRWRELFVNPGAPIAVPYSDANYNANGVDADWGVSSDDQIVYKTRQHGNTAKVWLTVNTSTIANTPSNLRVVFPNSWVAATSVAAWCWINDNGTTSHGRIVAQASLGYLQIEKVPGAPFANATNASGAHAQIEVEIN